MNPDNLPVYTADQLALRDGQATPEIWVAFQGVIYDVTRSDLFRGGRHFRHQAGRDLTAEMDRAPHTERVFDGFAAVGRLAKE